MARPIVKIKTVIVFMKSLLPQKTFYFLSHGETDWNKRGIYMGRTDIPLNDTGRSQAQESIPYIDKEPITHIVTSPLQRSLETATIVQLSLR
jgi:uncharacterized phosphatase